MPDLRRRPSAGYRLADQRRFLRLAELAVRSLGGPVRTALGGAALQVEDIPPAGEGAVLADFVPAAAGDPPRLILYRRPLELRAESKAHLVELLRSAVTLEVGDVLGFDLDEEG